MLRKDRVYEALRSLCAQRPAQSSALRRHIGFSAEEVAEKAAVDRTNASRDLNQLAHEGIIERIPGRPVLFRLKAVPPETSTTGQNGHYEAEQATLPAPLPAQQAGKVPSVAASVQIGTVVTSFETLIGYNEGLKVAIQQAKAAIIYPPRGLHTLLYGPSGVGKTTLARLMHSFALELKALPSDAPFVSFNCADYAGNPQLLMAHLFGVVRGAYTGAERDREGLVEQAHRGILFLDEVHRLPPEGQEMLFYLMDRERFRRLGDIKERQSSLLLLAATTEDSNSTLLPTFRRRIPMTITLPGLQERTITERYELMRAFFTTECSSIGTNIHVAPQVLRALLLYECPGNIGQLRTDIQLICARAYLEYRTHNLSEMYVNIDVVPTNIRGGLLRTADLHRTLGPLLHTLEATHVFTPTGLNLNSFPGSAYELYQSINIELNSLCKSGLNADEINELLHQDIQHYFQHFVDTMSLDHQEEFTQLADKQVTAISHAIVQLAEEQLERQLPEKLALVLALHLTSALEHINRGQSLIEPAIQSMQNTYPKEYQVAQVALKRINSALNITLPESEADVLTILFANANTLLSTEQAMVGIVVAAHGKGIATGLADLANTLVGSAAIFPVELTLEQSPEELLAQVEHRVTGADQGCGVLLLVDFASLLSLGELVTQRTGVQTRAVSGVCAPLVVEAVRRAQRANYMTLDQLTTSLIQSQIIDSSEQKFIRDKALERGAQISKDTASNEYSSRVILSVCLTGFGGASKLAEIIEVRLPELHQQGIKVLCMDINLSGKTAVDIQHLVGHRQVVAVVGTINPHLESYPFIPLTEILFGDGLTRLRTLAGSTLIDPALLQPAPSRTPSSVSITPTFTQRGDLIREISYTLGQRLLFLNPQRILPLIERLIEMIEVEVGEIFDIEVLAGLILHLACVLESDTQQRQKGLTVSEAVRTRIEHQFARELDICRRAWQILAAQIARPLPDEEAYNIVGILRQVDIFMINTL